GELRQRSECFAAALADRGVQQGDRVATLLGKSADLLTAMLGIWRLGAVYVPLFTAFAADAIATRLHGSGARVIIAAADQVAKLEDLRQGRTIIVSGDTDHADALTMAALLQQYEPGMAAVAGGGAAPYVELFTSGTTGQPKGVPIPVWSIASFVSYHHWGLDVSDDDVFWNIADPGWAYGLYYALIAPMACGHRSLLLAAGFSAALTLRVLQQ